MNERDDDSVKEQATEDSKAYEPPRVEEDLPLEIGSLACLKATGHTCGGGGNKS